MSYYSENREKWKDIYNNTEEYREYMKKYWLDNKEELREKNKKYCEEFSKEYEGKFIYFIFDELNKLKYIGKTSNIYRRMASHKNFKEKYNPQKDRVMYFDFSNKLTEEELEDAEKYFIELYKLGLNEKCGDYDTNIVFKIEDKDLIFNEFKFKKDNKVKPNEVYKIEKRKSASFYTASEKDKKEIEDETIFEGEYILFWSDFETVKHYINLDITDEEYEIMRKRVKDSYEFHEPATRHILKSLKNYKDITLADKGNAINHYCELLEGCSDEKLQDILSEEEMNLYKKIKGVDRND
ncbi:MAG: GIY-YIG nuclease family protein [Clostridium sp.]|uniref:GIY-YIG nuclease family protein n=1 Tax=Clostridium sp. TaxID=1506 RepID=UPI0029128395|nr:GIY-YIG nuclease family protein [Clostridium sp.]MDU7150144.1 GIY-YIG nuclease family protein [Clostridium sp.]MDU7243355.1 GIY-YIG nuclease family protein [Clostridium sp.]